MFRGIFYAAAIVSQVIGITTLLAQPPKPAAKPGNTPNAKSQAKSRPSVAKGYTKEQLSNYNFEASYGRVSSLKEAIEKRGIPVDAYSENGHTALHMVIMNYPTEQAWEREKIPQFNESFDYLISKGASLQAKTPDSLNCLQLAVKMGKYGAVQKVHEHDRNQQIRDPQGNTLLHLATQHSYVWIKDRSYMDRIIKKFNELDINTKNVNGQNPLVYFLSTPKKQSDYGIDMVRTLLDYNCNPYTTDNLGKNVYNYVASTNSWLKPWLTQYDLAEAESRKRMKEMDEQWKRQTAENLARYEAWKRGEGSGDRLLNESFTHTYTFLCSLAIDPKTKKQMLSGTRLDEPVTIEVSPSSVYISSLYPYYGKFRIASSNYEVVDGADAEVYYFEQTNSNSTYKGIAFHRGNRGIRALLKTSNGYEHLCNR